MKGKFVKSSKSLTILCKYWLCRCDLWPTFQHIFCQKIESVQYNAARAITRANKGSSCEKLYQGLGLEYLYQRRWARRLCLLYKVFSTVQPSYIMIHHHWEVLVNMLVHLIWPLVNLNISRTLSFLMSFMNGIN